MLVKIFLSLVVLIFTFHGGGMYRSHQEEGIRDTFNHKIQKADIIQTEIDRIAHYLNELPVRSMR